MTTTTLDRAFRVGIGFAQKTAAQLSPREIEARVTAYADALDRLHAAQVRLYRALLATDDIEAEYAAAGVNEAASSLPEMPPWPDTDEELIARLRGRFAPAPPADPLLDKTLTTIARREG